MTEPQYNDEKERTDSTADWPPISDDELRSHGFILPARSVTPRRSTCRNCFREIGVPSWAFSPDTWVHIDSRSGLYGGEDCYYTPRAEPVSSPGESRA